MTSWNRKLRHNNNDNKRFCEPALLPPTITTSSHSFPPSLTRRLTVCCVSAQKRPVEDSDWRKNVEAMSGMEGRKKMFDAAKGPAQ